MTVEQMLFRCALMAILGVVFALAVRWREARLRVDLIARHGYGLERKPGESDRELRARCLQRMRVQR